MPASAEEEESGTSRRLSKTCCECRRQHLRCDYSVREAEMHRRLAHLPVAARPRVQCTRCASRQLECEQVGVTVSRCLRRPSRTGKRIELGRRLHGSAVYTDNKPGENEAGPMGAGTSKPEGASHLGARLLLELLDAYFRYAHTHFPLVDYDHFVCAFNQAQGRVDVMAQIYNGQYGDQEMRTYFLQDAYGPGRDTAPGKVATPGTVETIIMLMLAFGTHYIDLAFEPRENEAFASMSSELLPIALQQDPTLAFQLTGGNASTGAGSAPGADDDPAGGTSPVSGEAPVRKRQRRRQGVACDTCRLRRVRCDLMEQPAGSNACSRCRVKRIACTDSYIQWKRQRDAERLHARATMPGNGNGAPLQLLPRSTEMPQRPVMPASVVRASQQELLEHGRMRETACNLMINRVLRLVHRHDLVHTCNLQSVVCLALLACLLDYSRREISRESQLRFAEHASRLRFGAVHDVSAYRDAEACDTMLNIVLLDRVELMLWLRDGLLRLTAQQLPQLRADWLRLVEQSPADGRMRDVDVARLDVMLEEQTHPAWAVVVYCCALLLLGQQMHRMAQGLVAPLSRAGYTPTSAHVESIGAQCRQIWADMRRLETQHTRCMRRGKSRVYALRPFVPVMWSCMVYMLGAVLHLTLTKRLRDWYAAYSSALASAAVTQGREQLALPELHELLVSSQEHALASSRLVAHVVKHMLPTGLLTRSTSITRQLFRVAECLTRAKPADGEEPSSPIGAAVFEPEKPAPLITAVSSLLNPAEGARATAAAEPLKTESTTEPDKSDEALDTCYDAIAGLPDKASLPPFTKHVKRIEVGWCIEALGQIGFAYSGLDEEIHHIVELLQAVT